jgi:ribose transport system ATP-binding protein
MPEMVALADRIVVMDNYKVQGAIENDGVYERMSEAIMNLIHKVQPEQVSATA